MKQTKIYFVRHGESELNKQSRISGGGVNPALTDEGRKQVLQTKLELKDVSFDVAYSSDLTRAIQTAEIIYGKPIPKSNIVHGLRERNFGSLDGKLDHHLKKGNQIRHALPHKESWTFKHVPDMESDHELSLRVLPALEEVAKSNPGKTVLVVAHGGSIRTTIMKLTGFTYKELPSGSFKNAGYVELTYDDSGFKVIQISGIKI